jgi:hypothetical protein
MFRHASLVLLAVFVVVGCSDSLVVAEQKKELDASDGGDRGQGVICGQAICKNKTVTVTVSGTGTDVPGFACCKDPANSVCGLVEFAATCLELNQPGRLEQSCPALPNTPLGTLPGCCRPDNTCGVYESDLGFGCAQVPFLSSLIQCMY